jgi:hypothetical protein
MMRAFLALVTSLAVVGVPLALNQCDATCAGARAAVAMASAESRQSDPICQRAATRVAQVDGVPDSCGHDHSAMERAAAGDTPVSRSLTVPAVAVSSITTASALLPTAGPGDPRCTSPPRGLAHALLSPLRI